MGGADGWESGISNHTGKKIDHGMGETELCCVPAGWWAAQGLPTTLCTFAGGSGSCSVLLLVIASLAVCARPPRALSCAQGIKKEFKKRRL